jgi:hypothetical protein
MTTLQVPDGHRLYVVTIKVHRNPAHNPRAKVPAKCNTSRECTDSTGEHHSYLTTGQSAAQVHQSALEVWGHVTRVEEMEIRL